MGTIDTAINRFEQVVDPTLIDCYIYELKAAQLRYQFLLRSIKEQGDKLQFELIYTHSACCRGGQAWHIIIKPGMKRPSFITCTLWV